MVSGLAPGSAAATWIVGKSTCGSGDTGSRPKASIPVSARPIVKSVVATGLVMKGAEMFMPVSRAHVAPIGRRRGRSPAWCRA